MYWLTLSKTSFTLCTAWPGTGSGAEQSPGNNSSPVAMDFNSNESLDEGNSKKWPQGWGGVMW